jgi:hypothetical protein
MTRRPFRPEDLADGDDAPSTADLAGALATARELEALAAFDVNPSDGFKDRVMGAIAAEPLPAPVRAVGAAARGRRLAALVGSFGDAWRVAWSGGRPFAVRAQALALVLVVVVALGSAGSLALVGGWNALSPLRSPDMTPAASPELTPLPTPTPSPSPSESAEPSAEPSESPGSSDSAEPTETPAGATEGGGAAATPRTTPGATVRPTASPTPTSEGSHTPEPSQTPEPTDDHGGSTPTPTPTNGG